MKKYFLPILALVLLVGFFVFYKKPNSNQKADDRKAEIVASQSVYEDLSLEEKIGQMIIGGFKNSTVDQELKELIEKYKIGGFNLLGRNIKTSIQTKKLISGMQKLAAERQKHPLFVAVDQEGGPISRLKFLKEMTPQGEMKDAEKAEKVARVRARELKELGFNMVFSPLLDYVSDSKSYLYPRVFHASPEKISELGGAMIAGYRAEGVLAVPKHFPGYGNILPDPHRKEAVFPGTLGEHNTAKSIFQNTLSRYSVDALMTAHVIIPFVDNLPATLSPKFINQILKEEMDYEGLVISDDLEMASALRGTGVGETAVRAVLAGNDILIATLNPENLPSIAEAVKASVKNGRISEDRINRSVEKIIKIKEKYLK